MGTTTTTRTSDEAKTLQRESALRTANETRARTAKLIASIKALEEADGLIEVARLLETTDWKESPHGALRVVRLLMAVRAMGERKVSRLLNVCGILSTRRMRSLSVRQTERLAANLRLAAKRRGQYRPK